MAPAYAANIAQVDGDCADRLFCSHVALLSGCASLPFLASRWALEPLGLLRDPFVKILIIDQKYN
ncbi:hypothetical protein MUK42_16859 [Musa troglodytarum]|uniref:Uncharacterized protein n=1 Tax=Musa troglodytarum TaxID=320322 RepID=A0A9E7HI04_9LILI|nr:hypothetical protein MUK42_16859 [Musa troglodytarum]